MTTYPAHDLLSPEARARIAERQREHEQWVQSMTEHFSKMVSAVTCNRHPDAQKELMREFIEGLESHFNEKYRRAV